jgi:hypothetical protein
MVKHFTPLAEPGSNAITTLALLCAYCGDMKRHFDWFVYIPWRAVAATRLRILTIAGWKMPGNHKRSNLIRAANPSGSLSALLRGGIRLLLQVCSTAGMGLEAPHRPKGRIMGCVNTTEHCSFCPETTDVLPCQGNAGHVCRNHNLVCNQHSYAREGSRLCLECHQSIGGIPAS